MARKTPSPTTTSAACDSSDTADETCSSASDTSTSKRYTVTLDKSNAKLDFTHYLGVFFWIGWTFIFFAFMVTGPFLFFYATPVFTFIVGLMILSLIMPIKRNLQPKWAYALGRWSMSKAAEYFQIKMVLVDKEAVEKSGQAIFALEPHHVLPLSIFAFNNFLCGFEGHDMLGLLTGLCFKMPLMRHVYTWVNAHSVDKKDMLSLLKKGISPVLCPGGVQEVTFLGDETQCVLYLKKRTGLFKIALQHGTPVIPVFSFGLQNSFSFWIPKAKWIQKLGRKCGALPMMFFGVFGLPMGPAKPCQYVNVIGKPLPLPSTEKIANPTNEQIKQYQEMYIEEITRLFHDYQDEFGMAGVTLRIE